MNDFPHIVAIVAAAGIGNRMNSHCPKQYMSIEQKSILEHSVTPLLANPHISRIVIVLDSDDTHFSTLPLSKNPRISRVSGGATRANSVMAGLQAASDADWVLIHDAARPCLHLKDVEKLMGLISKDSVGGLLAAPINDTIKYISPGENFVDHTLDRRQLWRALTPQIFPRDLLEECLCYALEARVPITDESLALELCGYQPMIVPGRGDNIKVTYPEDLALATFYLTKDQKKEFS